MRRTVRQALRGCKKAARGCASFRSVAQGGARRGGCSMLHKAAEGCKRLHEAAQARAGQRKASLDGRGRSMQQKMEAQGSRKLRQPAQ